MWCEQLTVDSSPDSESVQRADKVEERDETASPEPATEVLCRLSMADLQKLQEQDPMIGPVTAAWPTKPSRSSRNAPYGRWCSSIRVFFCCCFLKDGVLYHKQIDQQRGVLEQLVLPSTLRPDVVAALRDKVGQ